MSLVRYTSNGYLEPNPDNKGLVVVYKNSNSNEVVLYDPIANDFQIVEISKKYPSERGYGYHQNNGTQRNGPGNKLRIEDRRSSASDKHHFFICSVCKAYNRVDDEDDEDEERGGGPGGANRETRAGTDDDDVYAYDDNRDAESYATSLVPFPESTDSPDNFSGGFIRGDYFKLLTNSMHKDGIPDEPLITNGEITDDEYGHSIPKNLINQGYFDKFFKILSKLGSGSFGSVYKVEHELLGLNLGVFALKKIPIGDNVNNLRKILSEVKFLYDLSCNLSDNNKSNNNNVVKYNHVWVEIDQVSRFSPKIPVVFLLFEYCAGGTLEDWVDDVIKPKFNLTEEKNRRKLKSKDKNYLTPRYLNNFEIFKIFNDVTQGLNYLHNLKILHRDLKPSNCLFRTNFKNDYKSDPIRSVEEFEKIPTLLVSDFGESIMVNNLDGKLQNTIESTGTTGTLEFCAPEIILVRKSPSYKRSKLGGFSYSSDIYSLGMILYYLCFGQLPFSTSHLDPNDISNEILSAKLFDNLYTIRPLISTLKPDTHIDRTEDDGLLVDWVQLIELMVSKDPEKRPDTNIILNEMIKIYDKLQNGSESGDEMGVIADKENDLLDGEVMDDDIEVVSTSKWSGGKQVSNKTSAMMILMVVANLYVIQCSKNYVLSKLVLMLTNLQFLIMGLYFGGLQSSVIVVVEVIITIATMLLYSLASI